MKTVEILTGFHAYPNNKRRDFAAGETPDLANAFADLIVGKGLAVVIGEATEGDAADPEDAGAAGEAGDAETHPETA